MGQELTCTIELDGTRGTGKALLEHDRIIVRGDVRAAIPFAAIEELISQESSLLIRFAGRHARLDIGSAAAEKWVRAIRQPKSLLDKLGVKPTHRVAALHVADPGFEDLLRTRCDDVSMRRPKKDSDLIFVGAARTADLERLDALGGFLEPAGALWVVRPKGVPEITESQVMTAGKRAGLVDVKVVSFSPTLTAEKFAIPVARRKRG